MSQIMSGKMSGGLGGSPLLRVAAGALTGGAGAGMLGAGATGGAILGGLSQTNTPLGNSIGIANTASKFGAGKAEATPDDGNGKYNLGVDTSLPGSGGSGGAMSRALQTTMNSPEALIHSSLKTLDDPNLPIPYEARMAAVEPLLRAKHGVLS